MSKTAVQAPKPPGVVLPNSFRARVSNCASARESIVRHRSASHWTRMNSARSSVLVVEPVGEDQTHSIIGRGVDDVADEGTSSSISTSNLAPLAYEPSACFAASCLQARACQVAAARLPWITASTSTGRRGRGSKTT